jgi:hypothetical protein
MYCAGHDRDEKPQHSENRQAHQHDGERVPHERIAGRIGWQRRRHDEAPLAVERNALHHEQRPRGKRENALD